MLPADLLNRSFGRLIANCTHPALGLACAYVDEGMGWFPRGRGADGNPQVSRAATIAIADYYHAHAESFLETFQYPPDMTDQRRPERSTAKRR